MKNFLKLLFKVENFISIAKSLIVVIPAIISAVTYLIINFNSMIDTKLNEKLAPINKYMNIQVVYEIDKQFYKIKNDPTDVKPNDLLYVVQAYPGLEITYKTPTLDDKITIIRKYYMQLEGVSVSGF